MRDLVVNPNTGWPLSGDFVLVAVFVLTETPVTQGASTVAILTASFIILQVFIKRPLYAVVIATGIQLIKALQLSESNKKSRIHEIQTMQL